MAYDTGGVQYRTTSGYIQIMAAGRALPAFWAHPEMTGRYPGLVLLHDEWGLTPQTRAWVRRFAEMGLYVVAPDLFDGQRPADADQAAAMREALGGIAGVGRVNATLEVLKHHNRCTGRIAVMGWRMGGELAYHAAAYRTDLAAAIVFFGDPIQFLTILHANETPILAFYGEDDPTIPPEALDALSEAMRVSPAQDEFIVFPGVSGDFLDDSAEGYDPALAARTWRRMIGFLYERLDLSPHRR
jgi:carboxymethylenebutenolidase